MSGSETTVAAPPRQLGPFLCGLAFANAVFIGLFRFETAGVGLRRAAGLALGAALAGASLGSVPRAARGRWGMPATAVAAAVLWAVWAAGPPGWGLVACALAVALGLGLVARAAVLAGAGRGRRSFLLGAALGLAGCSAGLAGQVGLLALAVVGVGALAATSLALSARDGRPVSDEIPGEPAEGGGAALLLAAAVGAVGAALLRGYVPATHSLAYAGADLGLAFVLGLLVVLPASAGVRRGDAAVLYGLIACGAVSAVFGFSWFLHPDVVLSESAVAQTPASMLAAGRLFPVWALAFLLGLSGGAAWAGRRLALPLMAAGAGAAACALLPAPYRAAYVLSACLVAAGALLAVREGRRRTGAALRLGALCVAAGGVVWSLTADPHLGWLGLRLRLSGPEARQLGADAPALRVQDAAFGPEFLRATLTSGSRRFEFMDGGLIRTGEPDGAPARAFALALALGRAHYGSPRSTALLAPEPGADRAAAAGRAVALRPADLWVGRHDGRPDVVVCGPSLLTAVGNPLSLISVEGLSNVRGLMADDGVLALCIPVGWMHPATLQRTLATVAAVFPAFSVYALDEYAVVVASSRPELPYGDLERAWRELPSGAFACPADLLLTFLGDAGGLEAVWRGVSPYRLSHPVRPPRLAADLAEPSNVLSLATLYQHRLAGPDGVLRRLAFTGNAQRALALRGFAGAYADWTGAVLASLPRGGPGRQQQVLDFLKSESARYDLLAPGEQVQVLRVAVALGRFGLHEAAAEVLRKAVERQPRDTALLLRLAQLYAGPLMRPAEAAALARLVLELEPGNPAAKQVLAACAPAPAGELGR